MSVLDRPESIALSRSDVGRRLLVVRQDPSSRRLVPVGVLSIGEDLTFDFSYLTGDGVGPVLDSMPDRSRRFVTEHLPAFFATRVMDPKQPSFADWVHAYDLSMPISPVEILARSGGGRFTDTFHIVELLVPDAEGRARAHFMVSGVRHIKDAGIIDRLVPGEKLLMRPEPENPRNARARMLEARGSQVGWVPDWMLPTVEAVERAGGDLAFHVVRINDVGLGSHLRVFASVDLLVPPGTDLYPQLGDAEA